MPRKTSYSAGTAIGSSSSLPKMPPTPRVGRASAVGCASSSIARTPCCAPRTPAHRSMPLASNPRRRCGRRRSVAASFRGGPKGRTRNPRTSGLPAVLDSGFAAARRPGMTAMVLRSQALRHKAGLTVTQIYAVVRSEPEKAPVLVPAPVPEQPEADAEIAPQPATAEVVPVPSGRRSMGFFAR